MDWWNDAEKGETRKAPLLQQETPKMRATKETERSATEVEFSGGGFLWVSLGACDVVVGYSRWRAFSQKKETAVKTVAS